MSLNPKQQIFVDEYLKDVRKPVKAYKVAYPDVKNNYTARSAANRLLQNVDVQNAIKRAQKRISQKSEITAGRVIENLQRLAEKAEKKGNFTAAIRANELMGKQIGMFADRIKIDDLPTIKIEWANESKGHNGHDAQDARGAVGDIPGPDAV